MRAIDAGRAGRLRRSPVSTLVVFAALLVGSRGLLSADEITVKGTTLKGSVIEVSKEGINKIVGDADGNNVTPFPMPMYNPGGDSS